jgi:FkbM family methyltransferase
MLAALRTETRRWVGRLGQIARAADAAHTLESSLANVLDRRWRAAVSASNFVLLPRAVRKTLRVVVDVGASRGDWTDAILRLSRPSVVYAFEPNPTVFKALEGRLAGRNVRCVQAAVGATDGNATLHVEAQSELSSIHRLSARGRGLHGIEGCPTQSVSVPMVRLDTALSEVDEVSLLKLDVQGYESEVVAGAKRVLQRTDCLITEVMYERDYYGGAASCLELARIIEDVSPLRLSCISSPAMAPDGFGAWADAVFVSPKALGRVGAG